MHLLTAVIFRQRRPRPEMSSTRFCLKERTAWSMSSSTRCPWMASASYWRKPELLKWLRPTEISLTRASTSSASFLTDCAASPICVTAPLSGRAEEVLGAGQHRVDLVGRLVELGRHLAHVLQRVVDIAAVLAHRGDDVADEIDNAGDLVRVDRLEDAFRVGERGVELFRRVVEPGGEDSAVADQALMSSSSRPARR